MRYIINSEYAYFYDAAIIIKHGYGYFCCVLYYSTYTFVIICTRTICNDKFVYSLFVFYIFFLCPYHHRYHHNIDCDPNTPRTIKCGTARVQVYRAVKFYYIVESRTVWPNLWRVVNLIHILLILAHWFGCFYFLLSEVEGFQVSVSSSSLSLSLSLNHILTYFKCVLLGVISCSRVDETNSGCFSSVYEAISQIAKRPFKIAGIIILLGLLLSMQPSRCVVYMRVS